jgi:NAD+ diphosphatase
MEMNFCRRCGKPLQHVQAHAYKCDNGHTIFAGIAPAAGVLFLSADNQKILLATRAHEPGKGLLGIPGGFVDPMETLEAAAIRELNEELGLDAADYEPLRYLCSGADTYKYAGEPLPDISAVFWSRLITTRPIHPTEEVASIDWYDLKDVDLNQTHTEDVRAGIRALRAMFTNSTTKEQ